MVSRGTVLLRPWPMVVKGTEEYDCKYVTEEDESKYLNNPISRRRALIGIHMPGDFVN